jgi:hypothetical protein
METHTTGSASIADVIFDVNALLGAYRLNAFPGDFQVEQGNNMIYVVPTRTLGADGSSISVTSPLVTIPTAQRRVDESVKAILGAGGAGSD